MLKNMTIAAKAVFLSHGGGPLPLLGDAGHDELVQCLKNIANRIEKPKAIVLISAHWEAPVFTLTGQARPDLLYDYYGFPNEAYALAYPATGSPSLAARIQSMLIEQRIEASIETNRGFDHGMFVPMSLMYPEADVPCVQLSLKAELNPEEHIKVGKALRSLHDENILIIGSGFTFHNMRAFFGKAGPEVLEANAQFEQWLKQTTVAEMSDESSRSMALSQWDRAPGAKLCHPREEHLLPLHVCYGAAQSPAHAYFSFQIMGIQAGCIIW